MTVAYSTRDLKGITGLDEVTIIKLLTTGKIPARKKVSYTPTPTNKQLYLINPEDIWRLVTA